MLTKTIVYSPDINFDDCIDLYEILIKHTTLNNL